MTQHASLLKPRHENCVPCACRCPPPCRSSASSSPLRSQPRDAPSLQTPHPLSARRLHTWLSRMHKHPKRCAVGGGWRARTAAALRTLPAFVAVLRHIVAPGHLHRPCGADGPGVATVSGTKQLRRASGVNRESTTSVLASRLPCERLSFQRESSWLANGAENGAENGSELNPKHCCFFQHRQKGRLRTRHCG